MSDQKTGSWPEGPGVAAITGAAQGIGLAIAQELYQAGYWVAIGDLDAGAAVAAAESLGGRAAGFELDVTSSDSYQRFLTDAAAQFGDIDVLVNNAGVMWVGNFDEEPERALRSQIEVNLIGTILGVKLAAPTMRRRGSGQIISIASAASLLATPGEATYGATKHGVLGYLKAVRRELRGTGVLLTAVMPAVVDTKLASGTATGAAKILQPEDVSRAVLHSIGSSQFEVTLPGYVGPLNRLVNMLPGPLRDQAFSMLVPDQTKDTDQAARGEYESRFNEPKGKSKGKGN